MILYHTNYTTTDTHGKSSAAVSGDYDKKKYKYLETCCDFFKGSLENLELSRSKNV